MTARFSLPDLMASLQPGERGLVAHDVLSRAGRLSGPKDGRCETCGGEAPEAATYFLLDWSTLRWSCWPCTETRLRAEAAA